MNMRRRWVMGWALAAAACGDDATGSDADGTGMQATESGSGSATGPGTGDDDAPGSDGSGSSSAGSDTGGSLDETSEGSTAAATDDATGSSSDTGQPGACEGEGNCTIYPACMPGECGTLDSAFDEDGCLREACGIGVACPEGEVCYHAQWFGGCASSGIFCEDDPEQRACVCNSLPDCSGSYCVPEGLWPTPDPGPDDGQVDDACAPNDAPSTELSFGGLGTCPMDEVGVRLVFFSGPPEVGSYIFESQSDGFGEVTSGGVPVDVVAAWAEITALAGGVASGSYELVTQDAQHLAAEFTDAPVCAPGPLCG